MCPAWLASFLLLGEVRKRRQQREAQKAEQRQRMLTEQRQRAQQALSEAEELRPKWDDASGEFC